MSSRAEKLLAELSPNRPKTKPGDHLAWLVTLAKDGDWDDLVDYLAGNQPITARGRVAVAALIKELLEHRAGRPSGPSSVEQEAMQVAVWLMHAARDRFKQLHKRQNLRRDEIELLAHDAAAKVSSEILRLAVPLKVTDLIGPPGAAKNYPYDRPAGKQVEDLIREDYWTVAPAIVNELVAALDAHAVKSKPGR